MQNQLKDTTPWMLWDVCYFKECTKDVEKITSSDDLRAAFPDSDWGAVADEFDRIMIAFRKIGVDVHLADEKYFPVGHRGVYHTVSNHFYLNKTYVHRPHVLMSVVRHEGWHAAQDCMAGSIKNNMIAIIKNEEDVPEMWAEMARRAYALMPHASLGRKKQLGQVKPQV